MGKEQFPKIVSSTAIILAVVIINVIAFIPDIETIIFRAGNPIEIGSSSLFTVYFKAVSIIFSIGLLFSLSSFYVSISQRGDSFQSVIDSKINQVSISFKETLLHKFKILSQALLKILSVAVLFVFSEWLFFVTKPSFMDYLPLIDKVSIFFISVNFAWVLLIILTLIIFVLDLIFSLMLYPFLEDVYDLIPAFVLAGLVLLLVDNFTYTVFNFGIGTFQGWHRIIYTFIFGLFYFLFFTTIRQHNSFYHKKKNLKRQYLFFGLFFCISVVLALMNIKPPSDQDLNWQREEALMRPNIILVSDDGLNAENMSIYGYQRETTPFLKSIAPGSLLMLNNFTNANKSAGSDTAILTGKSPFSTRVLNSPNTLSDDDALDHLPGILKELGYTTISWGVPHFVDVNNVNFQGGFDVVNGEDTSTSWFVTKAASFGFNDPAYFFMTIFDRLTERLLHISFVRDLNNPYLMITHWEPFAVSKSMDVLLDSLVSDFVQSSENDQPLFAHIHLISTHGPTFYSDEPVFSYGADQTSDWMIDFYDDAILDYDRWLEELISRLDSRGYYQNTIFVFYTDHAERWAADKRIPLMIHFPNDYSSGVITSNSQNLDIAPTILDYLGLNIPNWMAGQSLLQDLDKTRLIFVATNKLEMEGEEKLNTLAINPPFYQFDGINIIQCQYVYKIDLKTGQMIQNLIPSYVEPCEDAILDEPDNIWSSAMTFLSENGFKIPDGWESPSVFILE